MRKQPDGVDIYIGDIIRKIRTGRKLSQRKLAQYVGVSYQQIQKYETAQNRLPAAHLLRIAKALDLPVQVFLPYNPDDPWGEKL